MILSFCFANHINTKYILFSPVGSCVTDNKNRAERKKKEDAALSSHRGWEQMAAQREADRQEMGASHYAELRAKNAAGGKVKVKALRLRTGRPGDQI